MRFVFGSLLCNTISLLCFLLILSFDTILCYHFLSVLQAYDIHCFKPQVNLAIPRIWGMLEPPHGSASVSPWPPSGTHSSVVPWEADCLTEKEGR